LKKVGTFTVILYLILSFISYGSKGEKRLLRQGKNLRTWLTEDTIEELYQYLDGAGVDVGNLIKNPYFYEGNSKAEFFLEIEGDFKGLILKSTGFIDDNFQINGRSYRVKYRPNYNEIAIIYDDERIYLSNSLERAYFGIENIAVSKDELGGYFEEDGDYSNRQIVYEKQKTIYGFSILEASEGSGDGKNKRLYFKSFSIDEDIRRDGKVGDVRIVVDYQEMAKTMMQSVPEIDLDPERLEELLADRVSGVFSLENGMVIKSRDPMSVESVIDLYNEGVLKRLGLVTGAEEGIDFLEIPFFEKKKYIFIEGKWIFISQNLEYIKKLEAISAEDRDGFLDRLKTLFEFKEEGSGYTRYKERV